MAIMAALAAILVHPVPSHAGTIAPAQSTDDILSGPAAGPCDPLSDSAGYVGGADIYGNPVAPADTGSGNIHVSMADEVAVPEVLTHLPNLDRVRVHVAVNGLGDAVSPRSACQATAPAPVPARRVKDSE